MNIQIIGAGSAGCHMARAAQQEGHIVTVSDKNDVQDRFQTLYQSRYKTDFVGEFDYNDSAD